jgi:tetratricopeptide (TPR) repeat protein
MNGGTRETVSGLILAGVLFVGAVYTSSKATKIRDAEELLSPQLLHTPMAGFEPLAADIQWIQLVQFMGMGYSSGKKEVYVDRLYRRFDRLTSLDPYFTIAYHYGTLFLSVEAPEKALSIVDRGLEYIPREELDWKLPFYGAFISYQYYKGDDQYDKCLVYLDQAMKHEGYPLYVPTFRAMIMERKGGAKEALEEWYRLYQGCDPSDKTFLQGNLERVADEILKTSKDDEAKKRATSILEEIKKGGEATPPKRRTTRRKVVSET